MAFADELFTDVQNTINEYGNPVRMRYFNKAFVTGSYDDQITLTQSGTDTWISGLVQPIGKSEQHLVQQGLLLTNDLVMYVDGGINVSGTWRVGIGSASPPTGEFVPLENNLVNSPNINGSVMYRMLFLRRIPTGSIFGE